MRQNNFQKLKLFKSILNIFLISGILAGCRTQPVNNIIGHPIASANSISLTLQEISDGIIHAGNRMGWKMTRKGNNSISAYYERSDCWAYVIITFTQINYNITYMKSGNISYNGKEIDEKYNEWIINLVSAIDNELNSTLNKAIFEKSEIYIKTIPRPANPVP